MTSLYSVQIQFITTNHKFSACSYAFQPKFVLKTKGLVPVENVPDVKACLVRLINQKTTGLIKENIRLIKVIVSMINDRPTGRLVA